MAVKRDHYVDDFICSTDSVPEAAKLISDVTIVHARGLRYPGWDDVLLERDYAKWVDYLDEVRKLSQLRIPRCYALRSSKIELHVFGDASEHAYAAVAYWRAVRPDGTVHLALVAGKSRVAPNKVMSIPRLELQAALLACRLATNIQKEHGIATERRVLCAPPAELDERSDRNEWRWVNSADNPADDATRADCDLEWLNGPTFLLRNEDACRSIMTSSMNA
ncbi:hypothetical protein EVAR_49722_1 [Eumeta japonica]|uniref:Uncharacterized protein n=1 Tax=Eumeta variegata TaxID=151549 RepID=A0A4C1ZR06_EUMVA|nr:hypothetical protein EVAR_49722_1 [Eumeta japonica]